MMIAGLFLACEEKEEDKDLVLGKWILVEETITFGSFTETNDYRSDVANADIFDIESDVITVYSNDFCSASYETEEMDVEITNSSMTFPDDTLTASYNLDGDELTISIEESEDGLTVSFEAVFEAYDGSIPPSEWSAIGDAYEPNNTAATATPITVDAEPQEHVLCGGESDWLGFGASAGVTYTMMTENDNGLDTYIKLYDAFGNFIDYDDDGGEGFNASLTWTCSSTGTYFFEVHGYDYDSWEEGPYEVSVVTGSGRMVDDHPPVDKSLIKYYLNIF